MLPMDILFYNLHVCYCYRVHQFPRDRGCPVIGRRAGSSFGLGGGKDLRGLTIFSVGAHQWRSQLGGGAPNVAGKKIKVLVSHIRRAEVFVIIIFITYCLCNCYHHTLKKYFYMVVSASEPKFSHFCVENIRFFSIVCW